jgi:Cof subfamily protein (haloacid dehalogenase superfamily)
MEDGLRTLREHYDAVLIDLDGTLLNAASELTPRTKAAVARLVEVGLEVVLCTGRSLAGTIEIHRELSLETPCVAFNGGYIGRPGETPWRYAPIPDELLHEVRRTEERAHFYFRHHRDRKYALSRAHVLYHRVARWYQNVVLVDDETRLPRSDLMRVSCFFDGDGLHEEAWLAISPDARERLHLETFPLRIFRDFADTELVLCEVQGRGRGKAEVFGWLREERGIEPARTIAIGDQSNDLTMLEAAGFAVSVANGVAAVLEKADLVIGHHDAEGFATWVHEGAPLENGVAGTDPGQGR